VKPRRSCPSRAAPGGRRADQWADPDRGHVVTAIAELDEAGDIEDDDMRRQFRTGIQERFPQLGRQLQIMRSQLDRLGRPDDQPAQVQAPDLLDRLPTIRGRSSPGSTAAGR
jgi:hypothetical protein